jgi:hypothetical protein
MGLLDIQRKIVGNKIEFSLNIFSYFDYVDVLDVEVHGYHMDITVVSQGYHRVLVALNYYKSSPVANLTPSK